MSSTDSGVTAAGGLHTSDAAAGAVADAALGAVTDAASGAVAEATSGDASAKRWPLVIGYLILVIPTMIGAAGESWSTEAGAHGPIVLATGLWLLYHRRALVPRHDRRGLPWPALIALLVPLLLLWAGGRAYDLLVVEAGALLLIGFALAAHVVGWRALLREPFPFTYFAFLVPIPGWILAMVTVPLQELVSWTTTHALAFAGYPVERSGVVITIAQYQLLVEEACAGMNSITGLIAISMFYIHMLYRADWKHAGILFLAIVPIAVFVNIVRVTILILLTYYAGDRVAQGFLHNTAGMVLFAGALALMVLVDAGVRRVIGRGEATL